MVTRLAYFVIGLMLATTPVYAADGVIEINQASVEAADGFPFVINEGGSYVLTSNLQVDTADTDGISIQGNLIDLDLNGFIIRGSGSGGSGVTAFFAQLDSYNAENTVRNGSIEGFEKGVDIGTGLVENIRARSNSGVGIFAVEAKVANCKANNNGSGIVGASVVDSEARDNAQFGIKASRLAARNYAEGNGGAEIILESDAAGLVIENVAIAGGGIVAIEMIGRSQGIGYANNTIRGLIEGGQAIGCNLHDNFVACPEGAVAALKPSK